MDITVFVDMRGLDEGLNLALRYTKRTPAQAVNTAACEVAIVAKNTMPAVSAEQIDKELNVMSIARVGASGRVLQQFTKKGKSVAKNKTLYGAQMGSVIKNVPLTVLIMVARAKPGSNYNRSTNWRYALSKNPFKGFSRALGRFKMTALIDNMLKARHRSGSFLMSGWIECVETLLPLSVNRWRKGSSSGPPMLGIKQYYGAHLGEAIPATAGGTEVACTISNLIGMRGVNAANFNRALWLYGAPALQASIDKEGKAQLEYFLEKSAKDELFDPVNLVWK